VIEQRAEAGAADARGGVCHFLQQWPQVALRGQRRAGAVQQFQHCRFIAQRFLGALDLVDVGAGAEPAQHLAVGAAHRVGAREEPAELAAGAADRDFQFKRAPSRRDCSQCASMAGRQSGA
jgi:hypothetical protein